jgi:dinuclear metal center YbgI/SA1388 family protein
MAGKNRQKIVSYLDRILRVQEIEDLSCNGLQVEGTENIKKIGLAVDACMAVFEKLKKADCQMLITHHGLIWGGIRSVSENMKRNLSFLLNNELNLYAAHLPLDLHPALGNNIQLCKILRLQKTREFGKYKNYVIGFQGELRRSLSIKEISRRLHQKIGGTSILLPFGKKAIKKIGIVSGGGADILVQAVEKGLDCFITGEPVHENYHLARESGINVIYVGHYDSEKHGLMAVGWHLEKKFGTKTVFIEEPTLI